MESFTLLQATNISTYPIPGGHFWVDDFPNFPELPCEAELRREGF